MRRSPTAVVATILVGLLVQGAAAIGAPASPVARSTELIAGPATDATLALPAKRTLDLSRPERLLRVPAPLAVAAAAESRRFAIRPALLPRASAPRARSHVARLRLRPPDDPPQPIVSA